MHTLPPTITASVIQWCPVMSVLAIGAERGPVILIRGSTGQQIWSAPGRKNHPVRGLTFSPDGQFIAVRYENGTFLVLQASNGRTVSAGAGPVSWLAWPEPADFDSIPTGPDSIEDLLGTNANEPAPPQNLVQGTPTGKLKLVLLGNLSLRELEVGNEPVTHICSENDLYGVVSGLRFVIYRCNFVDFALRSSALRISAASRAVDRIKTALKRYADELQALETNNRQFFTGLPDRNYLLTNFLANAHAKEVEDWMIQQHEGGFRRWYKAIVANLEEMNKQLIGVLVPNARRLVKLSSSLFCSHRQPARDFEIIDATQDLNLQIRMLLEHGLKTQRKMTALAGVLEYAFGQAIDRVLSITPKDMYQLESVCEFFVESPVPQVDVTTVSSLVTATWQDALGQLESTVEKVWEIPVAEPVVAAEIVDKNAFVLCDTKLYVSDLQTVQEFNLRGGQALVRGVAVSVDGNKVNYQNRDQLLKTVELDFEPGMLAVKSNGLCAMQKDMRAFSLLD